MSWDHLLRRQVKSDELKHQSNWYNTTLAKFDALHDNKLIEFFNSALQEQLSNRAFDLAELLELRDNIELCARSANKAGHAQLVQRLLKLYEGRVKSKRKRKCTLPLEGNTMNDKERDALLRRLMQKEKQSASTTNSNNNNTNAINRVNAISTNPEAVVDNTTHNTENDKTNFNTYNKTQEVSIVDSIERTPIKSNSTIMESKNISISVDSKTVESNITPPSALRSSGNINNNINHSSSSAKRRVSFDLPEININKIKNNIVNEVNSQGSTFSYSSSSSSLSFKPPIKPINPFAKKSNVPCVDIDAPTTVKGNHTMNDTLQPVRSTTTPIAEVKHSESEMNENNVESVVVDSTNVQERNNNRPTKVYSHNKENKNILTEEVVTTTTTLTKIQNVKDVEPTVKNKFIPQVLPNSGICTLNSLVTSKHNGTDHNNDILYEAQESDKCETISLDTVLASVNDENDDYNNEDDISSISTIHALSHSHVLGEALRKRYREDDNDDDGNEDVSHYE